MARKGISKKQAVKLRTNSCIRRRIGICPRDMKELEKAQNVDNWSLSFLGRSAYKQAMAWQRRVIAGEEY